MYEPLGARKSDKKDKDRKSNKKGAAGSRITAGGVGHDFLTGDKIKIVNMKSAPQFDNTFGIVMRFDDKINRYMVKSEVDGGTKALKPKNMEPVEDDNEAE